MKTALAKNAGVRALGIVLTLGSITAINTCMPILVSAAETPKETPAGFVDQFKEWQEKMSDAFRDTFKALRSDPSGSQLKGAVSADLREQNDSYTLRLSLPDRNLSNVEVTLQDTTLHVVAPEEGKSRRYEQSIVLSDASPGAKLKIDRKQDDNLILITIPKTSSPVKGVSPSAPNDHADQSLAQRDRDTMQKMWDLRRDMDRIFEDSFKPFRFMPKYEGLFDESRFGSSYTLEESGSNYVVRAYLPERNMTKVNVTIDGQTMKIDAQTEDGSKEKKTGASVMAHYTQLITLPEPVNALQMKVENKEGMVLVTVPKAGAK